MDFAAYWELFSKFFWPLCMAYALYVHRSYVNLDAKLNTLEVRYYEFRAEAQKNFATYSTVHELEVRLTQVLNRIDDKVTRILERDKNA